MAATADGAVEELIVLEPAPDLEVRDGVARLNELEFPSHGLPEGQRLRIGFRPYAVQISSAVKAYRYRAVLRHTYFLGVMLRVEMELPSGLLIRARMTKEEYAMDLTLTEPWTESVIIGRSLVNHL